MIENNKAAILWGFIKRSTNLKSLVGAGIENFSQQREPRLANGLVAGHAVSNSETIS
jgi:hypothetical protein